jgi:CRP-like cAMP-binding protein
MPQAVVDQTDEQAELVTVAAGSSVVKEGEPAEFFYVITAGEFDVVAGEPATRLNSLSVGHTFGEIGLLSTGVRTASVVARTDGEVLAVSVEDLNRIVEHAVAEGLDLHQAGARFAQEKIGAGGPGL